MKYNIYTVINGMTIVVTEIEAPECDGFLIGIDLEEQSGRASQYGRDIRGIVRGLWNGSIGFNQAFVLFSDTVRIGLTRAWHQGALECAINPADLTPEELTAMRQVIAREDLRIFGFIDAIEAGSKANGGKFAPLKSRAAMWALRYDDVVTRAKLMACADQPLEWVQGPTSDQCPTCTRMNGKVKRASAWKRNGVYPRAPENPTIQCKGFRCLCQLLLTEKPLSKGPLPRWP